MALPKLTITIDKANLVIDKLLQYRREVSHLEAKHQHFISEMIMLRLFSVFEDSVSEIAFKITAGALYTNGVQPALKQRSNNIAGSRGILLSFGRNKPLMNLKWTQSKNITDCVRHTFSNTEKYISRVQQHGEIIDEMRKVRNSIAHNSTSAKKDFRNLIRTTYGANISMPVGAFLTSTRRTPISNLERYLRSTKIIISEIASGT